MNILAKNFQSNESVKTGKGERMGSNRCFPINIIWLRVPTPSYVIG